MIDWYAQEQRASCVAACVRMVLSNFGQSLTEKQVRRLLEQTALGLSLEKACQRMRQNGAQAGWHDDWNLLDLRDCLRDGCFPIAGVERRYFGHPDALHAIVLLEISSHSVTFFDPLGNAQAEVVRLVTFEQAWSSAGQQVLIIKAAFPYLTRP